MKELLIGLGIGLAVGLTCTGCSIAKAMIKTQPLQVVLTDRNHVTTTKVNTEEGTYRIFMVENTNGDSGGLGITAIKIK